MRSEGYSSCLVYVCVSVCVSVWTRCLAVRAIKSIMKDTIVLSVRFAAILNCVFLKIVLFERQRVFYLPRQGRPFLVDAYSACNISYTLRYMFAFA